MSIDYDSFSIGAEVEFLKSNEICSGIVRYKGVVINREGNWIGVESAEPGR